MNHKLKEIFRQIQAEETLKTSTRIFLAQKMQEHARAKAARHRQYVYAAVCACLLLTLFGGHWLYFTSIAEISIDINPSIELSINRFKQVISVKGFNEDGREFSNVLHVKYRNYADAIGQILDHDFIVSLLSNDEVMTITVTGTDEIQSSEILSEVQACTAGQKNTYCYFAASEEVSAAHEAGLSYGKYRAFLELQMLDPDITPEAVQGMSMREIREWMERLSMERGNESVPYDNRGNRHHGNGYGRG